MAVIGVATMRFRGAGHALQITRGLSSRPIFITAVGMGQEAAAEHLKPMHGPYRIPTMLQRAHLLSKAAAAKTPTP